MCGICGIFSRNGESVSPTTLTEMRDQMLVRGPDAEGSYIAPHIALGHRRLAIIDLSPAGINPMSNEDGTVQIVLNGEIYNFQELRPELEAAGHTFFALKATPKLSFTDTNNGGRQSCSNASRECLRLRFGMVGGVSFSWRATALARSRFTF
ncbi:MAG: hypothetical protein IPK83_06800 [Planctomycetes bacterium]|nr:hypothetical protein [Planctomycetota bacterium]